MTGQALAVKRGGALIGVDAVRLPALIAAAGERAGIRFLEFFASTSRNPHTRHAYARAVSDFLAWCQNHGVASIAAVQPLHVAAWIEGQMQTYAAPTVKQQLAAIRHLFDWFSIPISLRDRALIALMIYSFGRVGAALAMKVEDVFVQNPRLWVRLREKGGKRHEMPCHHTLEEYLHAYLDGTGIADDAKGPLFRTIGRGTQRLTRTPCPRPMPTP